MTVFIRLLNQERMRVHSAKVEVQAGFTPSLVVWRSQTYTFDYRDNDTYVYRFPGVDVLKLPDGD